MRLHLDSSHVTNNATNNVSASAETGKSDTSLSTARAGSVVSVPGSYDSVAVSSASSAWSASFSDRATRVAQLTSAVQNGIYHASSTALSQSIVASATV